MGESRMTRESSDAMKQAAPAALTVAVIGVGSMGRNHVRVYSELPEAHLVGVADADFETARRVGQAFGVPGYQDYRQMLEETRPQAVTIAVPTALHEEVTLDALESGANVLVEKPIAATLGEGHRLIQRAKELKRQLMVGHIVRFNPAIQALKQKLDHGDLGRIYQIISRRAGPFPARIRDVGVVIDLAPHDLDLMRFLTGLDPLRVYAETEQRIHTDHEDLLLGLLRFPDNVSGLLEINWLTPTKLREVLVLGERGLLRVDDLTQDLYFYENAHASSLPWSSLQNIKGVSEGSMTRFALQRYEPLKAELQAFLRAIQSSSSMPVSGEDGLAALRLALALVESGQNHHIISM
jgi:UDP-N-acetylglucosamine 3-dehydrogenase